MSRSDDDRQRLGMPLRSTGVPKIFSAWMLTVGLPLWSLAAPWGRMAAMASLWEEVRDKMCGRLP